MQPVVGREGNHQIAKSPSKSTVSNNTVVSGSDDAIVYFFARCKPVPDMALPRAMACRYCCVKIKLELRALSFDNNICIADETCLIHIYINLTDK